MARSTVFTSNRSQAVVYQSLAFSEYVHRFEIVKIGQSRLISPVRQRWDDLFSSAMH